MNKTNKNGNMSIFIFMIPIIGLFLAFVFDNSLMFIENKRLEAVTKNIIEDCFTINVNDYYKKTKEDYEKQKITTEQLSVVYQNDILHIYNSHSYPSFFGKLLNINSYRSEINLKGFMREGKIIFIEVTDE